MRRRPFEAVTCCSTSRNQIGGWPTCHIAEHHESGMMLSFHVLPVKPV